jgi:type IV pilus biogenesis protein PilP
MRNKSLLFFCSAIAIAPSLGWAAEGNLSGVNVGELAIVQSQTILYKAQAERAAAERSINGEAAQPAATFLPQGNFLPTASAQTRNAGTQQELPVVKAVFGSGKRLRATLLYSGGFEVDADASSRELPGGYRIATLTVDTVTLEREGKRYPLGFSNLPPANLNTLSTPTPESAQPSLLLPGLVPNQR